MPKIISPKDFRRLMSGAYGRKPALTMRTVDGSPSTFDSATVDDMTNQNFEVLVGVRSLGELTPRQSRIAILVFGKEHPRMSGRVAARLLY